MAANKQQVFIEEYLQCWNAAEAARRAGYSVKTARSYGQQLLTKIDIQEEIQARLAEKQMSADEALTLLADMARGDLGEFMDAGTLMLDLRKAKDEGRTAIIKKLKQRTITKLGKNESDEDVEIHDLEIELYDAQAALDKILRVHGRYDDRLDLTSKGESIMSPEQIAQKVASLLVLAQERKDKADANNA